MGMQRVDMEQHNREQTHVWRQSAEIKSPLECRSAGRGLRSRTASWSSTKRHLRQVSERDGERGREREIRGTTSPRHIIPTLEVTPKEQPGGYGEDQIHQDGVTFKRMKEKKNIGKRTVVGSSERQDGWGGAPRAVLILSSSGLLLLGNGLRLLCDDSRGDFFSGRRGIKSSHRFAAIATTARRGGGGGGEERGAGDRIHGSAQTW